MTAQYTLSNGLIVTIDNDFEVAGGAKLFVYEAGTSTLIDTYSDAALTIPNPNPVEADANGRFGAIFLAADDYKFICKSNDEGTTFFTQDDYTIDDTLTFSGGLVESGGVVQLATSVNLQTGTSYTYLTGDRGKMVAHSNASAISATLPSAGASFPNGWFVDIVNIGAGALTITCASNIDGLSTLTIYQYEGIRIFSSGSTYYSNRGSASLNAKVGANLTIASGAVTITSPFSKYLIDTEGAAATDDLDTINGGVQGRVLILSTVNSARNIVIKHNVGNIYCPAGQNITLDTVYDNIILEYDSTLTKWVLASWQTANSVIPNITLGTTLASTSGTSIDFTSLPTGIKRITVNFQGVSTSGSSFVIIQLRVSGSFVTSGYLGSTDGSSATNITAGLTTSTHNSAADVRHGSIIINSMGGNIWTSVASIGLSNAANIAKGASSVALAGVVDGIRITTVGGADTFDAGNINISYEY